MKWNWIDPEVTCIQTAKGSMTLKGLFFPLFIEQLLMNLMGTVNTLMLGRYSDEAVAAVGAANQVIGLIFTFYAVVSGGASIVISHRLGAEEGERATDAAFSALIFGGLLSSVCGLMLAHFAAPLMGLLHLEGEVLSMAVEYFRLCIGFSVFQGVLSAASAVLRSYGKPRVAVGVSLFMNVLNAGLNYLIIYRPVEIPLYGTRGVAVANVISHILAFAAIMVALYVTGVGGQMRKKSLKTLRCIVPILKVGMPGGFSSLSYSLSQVISTSILAILGTTALSTKIYISSIVFYVYVVGMALGMSTAILIGWMAGAGEHEKAYKLNQQVLRIAVVLNLCLSVLMLMFYQPLLGMFTSNPEIITQARLILFIDIFVELGRAFNHVENSSLQGAGDVFFPMVVSTISCWLVSILFSYILGIQLGMGLAGCWLAFMMDELFRGLLFWHRFRSGKWKTKQV